MKSLFLAASGAVLLASAAAAQIHPGPPSGPAQSHAYSQGAAQGVSTARTERCQLVYGGYYVLALAAPRGAASWDLDLRAPGLNTSQGGALHGSSTDMTMLSQMVLLRDPTGRGITTLRSRPVHAELTVRDQRGRTVCRDTIRTNRAP